MTFLCHAQYQLALFVQLHCACTGTLTGETRAGIKKIVTLVDYEDEQQAATSSTIRHRYDIEVIGLFTSSEIQAVNVN